MPEPRTRSEFGWAINLACASLVARCCPFKRIHVN